MDINPKNSIRSYSNNNLNDNQNESDNEPDYSFGSQTVSKHNIFRDASNIIDKSTGFIVRRFEVPLPNGGTVGVFSKRPQPEQPPKISDKALKLMKHVEDIYGLTGIFSDKYEKNQKTYGNLTYLGNLRITLNGLKPYINRGQLMFSGNKLVAAKEFESDYINSVVDDINRKISVLLPDVAEQLIVDAQYDMAPQEEYEKGYRLDSNGQLR